MVVPTNQTTETAVEEPKVEQEPEQQQQAVQAAVVEEQDDGGWEAVPTKPKKGKNKTNQKDNKGLFTYLFTYHYQPMTHHRRTFH